MKLNVNVLVSEIERTSTGANVHYGKAIIGNLRFYQNDTTEEGKKYFNNAIDFANRFIKRIPISFIEMEHGLSSDPFLLENIKTWDKDTALGLDEEEM